MGFDRKFFLILFIVLYVLILGWDIWLYTLPSHTTSWNYIRTAIFSIFFLVSGIIAIISALQIQTQNDFVKMMVHFGYAMIAYWGSNTIWALFAVFTKESNPNNLLINVFNVLLYPFFFLGIWHLSRLYQNLITKRLLFNIFIISLISLFIIFSIYTLPIFSKQTPLISILSNSYFLIGDVIIFSMVLAALRIGAAHKSLYIFAFGLLVLVIADAFFTYRTAAGTYWQGDFSDTLYATSAFFASIGLVEVIHSSQRQETKFEGK